MSIKNEGYVPGRLRVCVVVLNLYKKIPEQYAMVSISWHTET
jgi:hypothetical protein